MRFGPLLGTWVVEDQRLIAYLTRIPIRVRTKADRTQQPFEYGPDPSCSHFWLMGLRQGAATSPFSTRAPCQERAYPGHSHNPLPTWLTHFEDYEDDSERILSSLDDLLAPEFQFPPPIMVDRHSGRMSASGHNPAFDVCALPPWLSHYRYRE